MSVIIFAAGLFSLAALCFPAFLTAADPYQKGDSVIGASAGYLFPQGYYEQTIPRAPFAELFFIPYTSEMTFLSGRAAYSAYRVQGSSGSVMNAALLSAGPSLYYSYGFFTVHGGLCGDLRYLYLNTQRTEKKLHTVKPGGGAAAGFFINLPAGSMLDAGVRYAAFYLSGKIFHETSVYCGISYNIGYLQRSGTVIEKQSDSLSAFTEGVKAYNARNIFQARIHFKKAADSGENAEAVNYLKKIDSIIADYKKASSLTDDGRFYEAVPLLDRHAQQMTEAEEMLKQIRSRLSVEIEQLEKEGVAAYEGKNYKKCIYNMKKITIIDPDNRTAKIYLPRALKRAEAIEKLR